MGTILAVILAWAASLAGVYALFRSGAREDVSPAPTTQPGHIETHQLELFAEQAVRRHLQKTQDELEQQFKKLRDQVEWDLGEWYEKFSTLHARSAKRQQRAAQPNGQSGLPLVEEQPRMSVLHHRKPWSP